MYEVTIDAEFCAAHAITIDGTRETVHGHNWRVRVTVAAPTLDDDGLVCDFHVLERELNAIIEPLHNADLNATPPFDRVNPTAERVAEHIGTRLAAQLPAGTSLVCASVTEAPGCRATYRP